MRRFAQSSTRGDGWTAALNYSTMHRDYRYTVYVLALTALVTLATVGLAAAGSANTSVPADASLSNADIEVVDHDDALDDEDRRSPRTRP